MSKRGRGIDGRSVIRICAKSWVSFFQSVHCRFIWPLVIAEQTHLFLNLIGNGCQLVFLQFMYMRHSVIAVYMKHRLSSVPANRVCETQQRVKRLDYPCYGPTCPLPDTRGLNYIRPEKLHIKNFKVKLKRENSYHTIISVTEHRNLQMTCGQPKCCVLAK